MLAGYTSQHWTRWMIENYSPINSIQQFYLLVHESPILICLLLAAELRYDVSKTRWNLQTPRLGGLGDENTRWGMSVIVIMQINKIVVFCQGLASRERLLQVVVNEARWQWIFHQWKSVSFILVWAIKSSKYWITAYWEGLLH